METATVAGAAKPAGVAAAAAPSGRLASIDAYRGFVMLLMMGEVLEFAKVSAAVPGIWLWAFLARHQNHVDWNGCVLHDMIQPSFSFLVGVALPFSLARRKAEGQLRWQLTAHAFWRALILVLLGVFLRSLRSPITNWTFEDTLTQIGLGYGFLYVLAWRSLRAQWTALIAILIGYWLAFALYPLPGPAFDWTANGAKAYYTGFAAHWNLNTNFAWAFDTWFLNLFPRVTPFVRNAGGYATLSFIPTLGTMILGLFAGEALRSQRTPMGKVAWFAAAGAIGVLLGLCLDKTGICPSVKRIWTPSWTLLSGGICFLMLSGFYLVIDIWNRRAWAFPLVVVGMNSIAAYMIAHLFDMFIAAALPRHLGWWWITFAGSAYEPIILGAAVLLTEWLILLWMFRQKIFLKI
ncbi:DUF5009 domain-containing protein [bacterium]|nr:DUF5009 domain-containing protein [bacterium]